MSHSTPSRVAIIGGGPAGLMAAEVLAVAGMKVSVFDAMPSVGRKFLMAGKGGMNITHSEALEPFISRYAERAARLAPFIEAFTPAQLREWIHSQGISTFVGSSGRVFPADMKAAPLLRVWLHRLRERGVQLHVRHRWQGNITTSNSGFDLHFTTPEGERSFQADAVILALGGGSWARLGSDGAWVPWLRQHDVEVASLKPANCGFNVAWSAHLRERFAGTPVKSVILHCHDVDGTQHSRHGEFVITEHGVEGGPIYALSAYLREQIAAHGNATLYLDLAPDRTVAKLTEAIAQPRGSRSLSSHLQRKAGISGVKMSLLHECAGEVLHDPARLAQAIKSLPLTLQSTRPLDEAISTAGGVRFEAMDEQLMLRRLPGVFCAGEMLDWEAPTGGYLLTACFATGRAAAQGALKWLDEQISG